MAVGPTQLLIILVVVLLLFGASRLPQLGKNLGAGIRNLKEGLAGELPDDEPDEAGDPRRLPRKKGARRRKKAARDEA